MECLSIVNGRLRKQALSSSWPDVRYELYGLHLCPSLSSTSASVKSATKPAESMNWALRLEHLVCRTGTSGESCVLTIGHSLLRLLKALK